MGTNCIQIRRKYFKKTVHSTKMSNAPGLVEGMNELNVEETTIPSMTRAYRSTLAPSLPVRRSGRVPPKRSQSQKIGRPAFHPVEQQVQKQRRQPIRGVNRSQSTRVKSSTRNVPARTSSTSSLRRGSVTKRQPQQQIHGSNATATTGTIDTDDISVSDSVFTSISIATMDSIAVRKSQIPSIKRNVAESRTSTKIEFEDQVGYLNDDDYDNNLFEYEDELSVFSESWCSSESCEVLSDFEEDEMDGAILENEDEDGNDKKVQLSKTE